MKRRLLRYILCIIFTLLALNLRAASFMLDGITAGDTRYDVKKVFDGNDDYLCWAFSASNAINYWQNTKISQGVTVPTGTPIGMPNETYSSDIAQVFVDNWTNDGGEECNAFNWWIAGTAPDPDEDSSILKPDATGGGYWAATPYASGVISREVDFKDDTVDNYSLFFDAFNNAISNKYALTCGIYAIDGGAHAVTLWGYEIDDLTKDVVGIWICDSDNTDVVGNYLVDINWDTEEEAWTLGNSEMGDFDYTGWALGDISMLMASIPEPSTYALIFSMVAFVFAVYYRRK